MKRIIFSFIMAFCVMLSVNAQIARETQKTFDNVYMGIQGGTFTPLDFNSMFPLNGVAGLKVGKQFTPVWGAEVEGNVFFNENNFQEWTTIFVKGTNVGLNGTMNLTNLLNGYKGGPRTFEVKTNAGLGWMHLWNAGKTNFLTAKTAFDFDFNFGKTKAHTLSLSPGVFWVLNPIHKIQFNKEFAQLGVMLGYTYHFKTSNGSRHFVTYNVGSLIDENNRLLAELDKKPTEVVKEVIKEVPIPTVVNNEVVIFFAKGSAVLTDEAKATLDKIEGVVDIYGFTSPEGPKTFNDKLAEMRAQVVADYLVNSPNDVRIGNCEGKGTIDDTTGRVTIIKVEK